MGQDDDEDCVEHLWQLEELGLTRGQLDVASVCARCGAISYEPTQAARRPPL